MSSSNLAVARKSFAITPHASTNFTDRARAIYVGVGGDIAVVDSLGTVTTFVGVPQGSILPVECKRVNAVGTTASSLVGLV